MNDSEFRDKYANLVLHYNSLLGDIYEQPDDPGHIAMATEIITKWLPLATSVKTVLDVGCGTGFLQETFESFDREYTGITLGEDFLVAKGLGRNVYNMDFNFLEFPDNSFDLIFSRHSLEHSPFPLLTLMEWYRVSRDFLFLVLPTPSAYGWGGQNHYSVMELEQAKFLLNRAGWKHIWDNETEKKEIRLFCEKIRYK